MKAVLLESLLAAFLLSIVCVCVCERERERETHTHTRTHTHTLSFSLSLSLSHTHTHTHTYTHMCTHTCARTHTRTWEAITLKTLLLVPPLRAIVCVYLFCNTSFGLIHCFISFLVLFPLSFFYYSYCLLLLSF